MMEYRNTPRKDGLSPAQRLFGRPMRSTLPNHPLIFHQPIRKAVAAADKKAETLRKKAKERYDASSKELDKLEIGDIVRCQHMITKKWDLVAEVVEVDSRERSYRIRSETGRLYWRNRRYLKKYTPTKGSSGAQAGEPDDDEDSVEKNPRRSSRQKRKPERFQSA